MFLTRIVLNLDDAAARADFSQPYEMHSTLARAFVSEVESTEKPAPFLWRLEPVLNAAEPVLLVQSSTLPRWDALATRSRDWSREITTREIELEKWTTAGLKLGFRLSANPTVTREGKRHGLKTMGEQVDWLQRQATKSGFDLLETVVTGSRRIACKRRKSGDGAQVVVNSVTFDGLLLVTDSSAFAACLRTGLGHAKFLGLGLLSVAPVRR